MFEGNNISFSDEELQIFADKDYIDKKREIQRKISLLLSLCEKELRISADGLPALWQATGKISKGENHKGYPYAVLDYPRRIEGQNIIIFRTMWWWGHGFICSLMLTGEWLEKYRKNFIAYLHLLYDKQLFISTGTSPWDNDQGEGALEGIDNFSPDALTAIIDKKPFLRISSFLSLDQWRDTPDFARKTFDKLQFIFEVSEV
ncbi:MAG: hypothetical protein JJU28_18245 [Cyclobacteriaceae bacterium]|nr:hypothetical protein [Cyclobacteriaceae bacterium]